MADIPYSNATSGAQAREEITKLLRRMGCDKVGIVVMVHYDRETCVRPVDRSAEIAPYSDQPRHK